MALADAPDVRTADALRQQVVNATRELIRLGLNVSAAGNVSVRTPAGFCITPSGVGPDHLQAGDLVDVALDGTPLTPGKPSSEWRFHRDLYVARPDVGAVVHAHSPFATSLACLREDIPPFHYMIAMAGGNTIRCAPYALFGTQALSDAVVTAMIGRKACLLANHGMIACGSTLVAAMALAVEVETLCGQYWRARQVGEPVLLTEAEMAEVHVQFSGYGDPATRT